MSMDWFCHSHGLSSDAKLSLAAQKAGVRRCEMIAFWNCILEHASAHEDRGFVGDLNFDVIAFSLEIDLDVTKKMYVTLHTVSALHDRYVKNFFRYNFVTSKRPMTGAERVRKYRENKKKEPLSEPRENNDVTKCNDVTPHTLHNNISSEAKASSDSPKLKIEFDFVSGKFQNITDQNLQQWGEAFPALKIDEQIAKAAAWQLANPKNRKSNYAKFLVNWFTRAQDKAPPVNGPSRQLPMTFSDISKQKTDQAIEEARKKYAQPN